MPWDALTGSWIQNRVNKKWNDGAVVTLWVDHSFFFWAIHIKNSDFDNIGMGKQNCFYYVCSPNPIVMTYKFKSLVYFSCFVIASVIYYVVEQHDNFQNQLNSKNYAEVEYLDTEDPQAHKEELKETKK